MPSSLGGPRLNIAKLAVVMAAAASLQADSRKAIAAELSKPPSVTVYLEAAHPGFSWTKSMADRMLAAADVKVEWRVGQPGSGASAGIVVSIRFADAPSQGLDPGALARAWPFGDGAHRIEVFDDRVRLVASASGIEVYKLMAHVLVHEITHIIERESHHSETGIMKAHWTRSDYLAMAWKPLPFAGEDLERIQAALERTSRIGRTSSATPENATEHWRPGEEMPSVLGRTAPKALFRSTLLSSRRDLKRSGLVIRVSSFSGLGLIRESPGGLRPSSGLDRGAQPQLPARQSTRLLGDSSQQFIRCRWSSTSFSGGIILRRNLLHHIHQNQVQGSVFLLH